MGRLLICCLELDYDLGITPNRPTQTMHPPSNMGPIWNVGVWISNVFPKQLQSELLYNWIIIIFQAIKE